MNAVKEPGLLDAEEDQILSSEDESSCQKYLIFVIDNLRLGVDVKYVVEILNNHSATYLPMMPDYIRGIFNMRGQIIPVLDIRLRLGKAANETDDLLVVLNFDNTQIGILVDAVDQMIEIPSDDILPLRVLNSWFPACVPFRMALVLCWFWIANVC